jgi:hypothetical protein
VRDGATGVIPRVMGVRPTQRDENRRCCHPLRKQGSTLVQNEMDSRFRGNDWQRAIFERAERGISLGAEMTRLGVSRSY